MVRNDVDKNVSGFMLPVAISVIGALLIVQDISIYLLDVHLISTAGVGIFAIGASVLVILANDAWNRFLNPEQLFRISQILYVIAASLTFGVYEGMFTTEAVTLIITMISVLGISMALIVNRLNLNEDELYYVF